MTATQWLEAFASFSLQVLVMVSACKLLEPTLVRSADRSSLWNTCFLSILLLATAALLLPRLHLVQPWSNLPPRVILSASTAQAIIGKSLLALWCMGACISMIHWIAKSFYVRRLLIRCEELPEWRVDRLLHLANVQRVSQELPRLLISDEVQGPFCLQLHQPTIVLPRYLWEGSSDDLQHVLFHELEHLKTNHPFQLFLQQLVQVVCWFHPAVWKASYHASLVREFCCDDAATTQEKSSAAYLRTLLRIAERGEQVKHASMIAFGRAPSEIVLRAQRLVRAARGAMPQDSIVLIGRKTAMCLLLLVACTMAFLSVPSDPLSSTRSVWSPWPKWTAETLHCFGFHVRDYEPFDGRVKPYELQLELANRNLQSYEALARH